MSNVRYREDTGWEMRCEECPIGSTTRWWPLDVEWWNPRNMARCRACTAKRKLDYERRHHAQRRAYLADYRKDDKAATRIRNREYYLAHREEALAYNKAWKAANRERENANARRRYHARKDEAA